MSVHHFITSSAFLVLSALAMAEDGASSIPIHSTLVNVRFCQIMYQSYKVDVSCGSSVREPSFCRQDSEWECDIFLNKQHDHPSVCCGLNLENGISEETASNIIGLVKEAIEYRGPEGRSLHPIQDYEITQIMSIRKDAPNLYRMHTEVVGYGMPTPPEGLDILIEILPNARPPYNLRFKGIEDHQKDI